MRTGRITQLLLAAVTLLVVGLPARAQKRTIVADVVALDQAFYNNRLGSFQAGGMIFALRRDVVSNTSDPNLSAGNVTLRSGKRARPIVLRMNVGDCLQVNFENLLADVPSVGNGTKTKPDPNSANFDSPDYLNSQPATRFAGVHVMGTELKEVIDDDASWVGRNPLGLVAPGKKKTYKFCAVGEGAFLLYSTAADIGFQNDFGGQLTQGLFGSVIVEPETAEWYRSQVTKADLDKATYTDGQLPAGMTLAPKGSPQEKFTFEGKTYKLWTLTKTGPGGGRTLTGHSTGARETARRCHSSAAAHSPNFFHQPHFDWSQNSPPVRRQNQQ